MSEMQAAYKEFIEGPGGRVILCEPVTDIDAEYLWTRGYYAAEAAMRAQHALDMAARDAVIATLRERLKNERDASHEAEVWYINHR